MSAPTDKAANNIVVVCRIHYISVLKQELGSVKTWEPILLDVVLSLIGITSYDRIFWCIC